MAAKNRVVSEMLGRADASTTLRMHAHVLEEAQEQAASYMDPSLTAEDESKSPIAWV